ncbi:hypothetical protein CLCY_3c00670 [Clostridium cylindrosporum DSM 605]|uniref:Lipoprotein n=1 Tax=Clostridium cylindrosporum DSM 605 TaxID=1121307 RepID=A0A0J8D6U6_CLOCY|nr:hypothetical protein [Clostridium cylindrosporum]KMT21800.1 hypothetical protein CLCY_3c00670 [Clostridium cylindrosporum DSM 605]
MRKLITVLIMTVLFILAGCSNEEVIQESLIYKGENESWRAEYKVDSKITTTTKDNIINKYEGKKSDLLTVTYKKDLSQLASVKHLKITYNSSCSGGSLEDEFDKNNPIDKKTFKIQGVSGGVEVEKKDEIVKVNINVDGKIQTIELKSIN